MKIRFRKNTIRYRLDQIDIKKLKKKGFCEEETDIPPKKFIFSLAISKDDNTNIASEPFHLKLKVSPALIAPVLEGSDIGFECRIPGAGDSILDILVEKDFKCLTPRGEEDANAFENPLSGSATC